MTTRLATPRLDLAPLGTPDVEAFHAISIEPEVRRYLWDDVVITSEQAREVVESNEALWLGKAYGLFAVRERGQRELAGYVGLWDMPGHPPAELLYALGSRWWGRGLAFEASRAVMHDAVERLGLREIVASTDVPNEAAIRLMKRLGMTFVRREMIGELDTAFYRIDAAALLAS